jgi:hypothetical protein
VAVEDAANAVVATDNSTVISLAIGTNPAGGSLACSGGTSLTVVNGVASFSGCSIDLGSTSAYTLVATSNPAYSGATSAAFLVTVPVAVSTSQIASDTAVGDTRTGFSISTKVVRVGATITLRFETNPSLAGKTIGVWIARKTDGVWSAFAPHASVTVGDDGVAYYVYSGGSQVWESFLGAFAGDATTAASRSHARQARWT